MKILCLSPLRCTSADEIVSTLMDALQLMQLKLGDVCGQCYDGTATMSGQKSMNGKCLFTHCYGHALNLGIGGTIKRGEKFVIFLTSFLKFASW